MAAGLEKTLSLVLLILLGVLLKSKIKNKEQLGGIKTLILSVALPATIFIALLKIQIKPSLIILPLLALAINLLLFIGGKAIIKIMDIPADSAKSRTLLMLIPSFAPGLSCFPFLTEYLGGESLALAALADVGNKVFVLIILYLLAMHWYYQLQAKKSTIEHKENNRLKELALALLREPINLVILIAILLLCLGGNIESLPAFFQNTITRLSVLMTPLVLIFIGLAVKIRKGDTIPLLQILFWRSGFAFLVSAILLFFLPAGIASTTLLLAVIFPQSACSFWPFAHMTAVQKLEGAQKEATFDIDLGLNVLAFSLPFSTMIILTICSTGSLFTNPILVLTIALVTLGIALLPSFLKIKTNQKAVSLSTDT